MDTAIVVMDVIFIVMGLAYMVGGGDGNGDDDDNYDPERL
jgi:hypothetical protein